MTSQERLEQLRGRILAETACHELASQATQLVMGQGNLDADIVFIGEAPGKKEDETGEPFVGASGRFLNEMLAAADLLRKDVYITNIVKYRPPNNRDPTSEEKRVFWPYLMEQLEIIRASVIITLGRHSGAAFIPQLVISRDHGKVCEYRHGDHSFVVIPLYHPAAALYNGSMRQVLVNDFLEAARLTRLQ